MKKCNDNPREVWISLPEATQTPALSYPTLRVTRLLGTAYSDGIETVTDCFKFRNKIGLDVALLDDLLWPPTQVVAAGSRATATWSPEAQRWV